MLLKQSNSQRGTKVFRLILVLIGVAILSGCVIAPSGYGYGYGYRVHPIIHPLWRRGWRR